MAYCVGLAVADFVPAGKDLLILKRNKMLLDGFNHEKADAEFCDRKLLESLGSLFGSRPIPHCWGACWAPIMGRNKPEWANVMSLVSVVDW